MLNRKDLFGGVALGTVLCCVLGVGAMTTSANAFVGAGHGSANPQNTTQQVVTAAGIEKAAASN
jgi:hypothetical protein